MSSENTPIRRIFDSQPDKSSGSNDVFFRGQEVYKILKADAAVYQFCTDCSPKDILALLERVKSYMEAAFGDMLLPTQYFIEQDKIITKQALVTGKTLKELGQLPTLGLEALNSGISRLRANWQDDYELLGYIIEELNDPSNVLYTGEKIVIIDWL